MSVETPYNPPPPIIATPQDAPVPLTDVPALVKQPYAGPKHKTPKDMVDGLVLIREYKLLDDGAGELEMGVITGLTTTYAMQKRTGRTDLSWAEWYETADMDDVEDDKEKEPNPTTP